MNQVQSQIEFKDLQAAHAGQVAALHIQCISTGFISSMGIDFVTSLYEAIVQNKSSFGIVAVKNERVLGFVAFTTNINKLYKSVVWKKGVKFVLLLAGNLWSFKRIKKMFETLLYPAKTKNMNLPSAELLSIAVEPEEQGKGLASQLINNGFKHYQETNIDKVKVTVGADNKPGNKLYLKSGFKLAGQIVHHGIISNIYVAKTESV